MKRLIVARNVCDLYADPLQSERVSQAVLGQIVSQTSESQEYLHVETGDLYKGHVRRHALVACGNDVLGGKQKRKQVRALFAPVRVRPHKRGELITTLVMSSVVAVIGSHRQYSKVQLPDGAQGYVRTCELARVVSPLTGRLTGCTISGATRRAMNIAARLVGTPYLWGGCTPYGIDCSGFVQLCYGMAGLPMLRDAYMQFDDARWQPVAVGSAFADAELAAGDLVFFGKRTASGETAKVTHVGMILPDGRIIHSAGGYGVVIEERYQHRLCSSYLGARRLCPKAVAALLPA